VGPGLGRGTSQGDNLGPYNNHNHTRAKKEWDENVKGKQRIQQVDDPTSEKKKVKPTTNEQSTQPDEAQEKMLNPNTH